jgi:hypothetical protein
MLGFMEKLSDWKISESVFLSHLNLNFLASLILSGKKPKDLISKFREHIRRGK